MTGLSSCQTICQKSFTVLIMGPWVAMKAFSLPPYPWFRDRHKSIYFKLMWSTKIAGECSKRAEKWIWNKKKKKELFELKAFMTDSRADQKFFSRTVFPLETADSMDWNGPENTLIPLKFPCLLGSSSLLCSPSCWGFPSSSGTLIHDLYCCSVYKIVYSQQPREKKWEL